MAANEQAYNGLARLENTTGEWNRMQFAIKAVLNGVATATLVLIKAVDSAKQTVDAQPMVSQTDGAGNAVPHGTIHGMAFWRLQGGTNAAIIDPVVGDIGLAVFCHSDISAVKRTKTPNTPGSGRQFDYADGIYFGSVQGVAATQFIRMTADGIEITSPTKITLSAPEVDISGMLKNNDVNIGSDHTHTGVTAGGGTSGPPSP
jgi:hypothetical protein